MIEIMIGPKGELVVFDGHHRVSMLKHLGKPETIITRVRKRSPKWIEFKEKLFRLYGKKLLYQPMEHPDFEDSRARDGIIQKPLSGGE